MKQINIQKRRYLHATQLQERVINTFPEPQLGHPAQGCSGQITRYHHKIWIWFDIVVKDGWFDIVHGCVRYRYTRGISKLTKIYLVKSYSNKRSENAKTSKSCPISTHCTDQSFYLPEPIQFSFEVPFLQNNWKAIKLETEELNLAFSSTKKKKSWSNLHTRLYRGTDQTWTTHFQVHKCSYNKLFRKPKKLSIKNC